jgi:hypothetical protein
MFSPGAEKGTSCSFTLDAMRFPFMALADETRCSRTQKLCPLLQHHHHPPVCGAGGTRARVSQPAMHPEPPLPPSCDPIDDGPGLTAWGIAGCTLPPPPNLAPPRQPPGPFPGFLLCKETKTLVPFYTFLRLFGFDLAMVCRFLNLACPFTPYEPYLPRVELLVEGVEWALAGAGWWPPWTKTSLI